MLVVQQYRAAFFLLVFNLKWLIAASGVGPCPKLDLGVGPINLTRLTGHWYEIERSFYLMELISSCVTLDVTETIKGRLDIVVSTKSAWTGTFSISEGTAVQTRRDPNTYLYRVNSKLPRLFSRYLPGAGLYQILKTDYDKYALVYACSNYQVFHVDMIWIWGRKKEIEAELRSTLYSILDANNIDSERLILSKNGNCTEDILSDLDYYL